MKKVVKSVQIPFILSIFQMKNSFRVSIDFRFTTGLYKLYHTGAQMDIACIHCVLGKKCEKHILKTHSRQKFLNSSSIGVAPNTQATYVRNKNSNIQGRLYTINVVKVIFHTKRNCS